MIGWIVLAAAVLAIPMLAIRWRRPGGLAATGAGAVLVAVLSVTSALVTAEVMARQGGAVVDPTQLRHYQEYRIGRLALRPHLHEPWTTRNPALGSTFVRTNADGLRGDAPSHPTPRSVLFAGDSFTFGVGLEEPQTFPRVICDRLSRLTGQTWTALNAGEPGYNLRSTGEWVAHIAPRYRPSAIVVTFHQTDDVRADMNDSPRSVEARAPFPWMSRLALYRMIRLGSLTYRYYAAPPVFSDMGPRFSSQRNETFRGTVRSLQEVGRSLGAPVIFHVLYQEALDARIRTILQDMRVSVVTTSWESNSAALSLPGDGHPNPAGARMLAERVLPALTRVLSLSPP